MMKRPSVCLLLALSVLALFAPDASASSTDSLTFFNNWFVTGDYSVAGVGLRGTGQGGWATGKINMPGLPSGAQPIAAFLYWSTAEPTSTPGASVGYFNTFKIQGAVLGNPQIPNPGCSSTGSTAGYAFVYRADVLRYLPVDSNNIPQSKGAQTVKLPDSLTAQSGTLYTDGASLVVIYKIVVPGFSNIAPLRSVVIYNGAYTMNKQSAGFTQTVAGYYQSAPYAAARMTTIAANGQSGFLSPLSVNGTNLSSDPFVGAQGGRWDNPSYNISLAANSSSFSTMTTANGQACVTWAAIVASTNVQDSDGDGLLDVWETQGLHRNTQVFPATFGNCAQYPSEPCVNLPQMGANPNKRDIFIQIDWMHGTGDGTGGIDGRGTHDHTPQLAALSSVASVFANNGINLHFDVGPNYQGAQASCGNAPCAYIVPGANASGGSDMDEATLVCQSTATHACEYPGLNYPVLSFEFGFASVRDGNHLININPHFAQNRKDIFHYSLFAHALAGPFNVNGQPVDPFTGLPTTTPKSYSGIAHRPGGGFMVTLGLWRSDIPANDQVGSAQVQAGTLMHELGHNLGLGHAGLSTKPNCIPNYPSVMNYLYQTRGLTDTSGNEHIDYSYGVLLPMSENFLTTSIPIALFPGLQKYRVRYYGPLAPNQPSTQASQVHCDGSPITGGSPLEVRLESASLATPDWSNGNVPLGKISPPLDVNFDGTTGQLFIDQPDWLTLNLQQIGTGYSFGGLSVGGFATAAGAYATDGGAFATDAGALATDGGAFATDGGAFATDGGAFATDGGAFATDAGEIDETTLLLSSVDPPATLTAANPNGSGVTLTWNPPSVGQIQNYNVYRCAVIAPATSCTPAAPVFATANGGTPTPTFTDTVNDTADSGKGGSAICNTKTCYNTVYYYFVTSLVSVGGKITESVKSNIVNTEVPHLFVMANSPANAVYGSANPTPAFTIYGDAAGALANNLVSCVYGATGSPVTPRSAGTYPIACSGPANASPNNGVTYNTAYLTYTPGSLTITQRPITVTAAASTKVYDGTTSSPASPSMTGTLAYSDTAAFTEVYDNRNVGTTHAMTPSGAVSDGNGGSNYKVTLVTINTGVITALPITVTPSAASKMYDGGTTSPATPAIAPPLATGDTASFTEAYTGKNVGTNLPMTAAGGPVSDGNGGNNYRLTLSTANVGTITQLPITVTPAASTKPYDGLTTPQTGVTPTVVPPLVTGDTGAFSEAYVSRNAGTALPMTAAGTVTDGNSGGNYAVTFTGANVGTIAPSPLTVTAASFNKSYDGTVTVTATPTVAGTIIAPDAPRFAEAYQSRNAGSEALIPSGTVNDNNGGKNYAVTFVNGNGTISQLPVTIAAMTDSKVYDGTVLSSQTPVIVPPLVGGDTAIASQAFANKAAGPEALGVTSAAISDGNGGNNYAVTLAAAPGTINTRPLTVTAAGIDKPYDGTTTATVTLSDNRIAGDNFTDSYTSAAFASPNVGNNLTVNVSGVSIAGPDSGNYSVASTAAGTANILGFGGPYTLDQWTATANNPSYPGTTSITPPSGQSATGAFGYNLNLGNPASGVPASTWTFQTTAAPTGTGTVSFHWEYKGFHAYFEVTAMLQAFSGSNVVTLYSAGPVDCCTSPSGGFDIQGDATINVTAGTPFGFTVGGSNADSNSQVTGTLTITNFKAPF